MIYEYNKESRKEIIPENVTHVRFHPSVVQIEDEAFRDCTKLRDVVLNEGLLSMSKAVFSGCTSLESITLSSTISEIGNHAFDGCINLKDIVFNEGLQMIGSHVFYGCKSLQRSDLPSTLIEIGNSAFGYCTQLKEVVFNGGLQIIRCYAFDRCNSLRRVTLPSTVSEVQWQVFYGCNNLREVLLNEGLQRIGHKAFFNCSSLPCITFPSTVTEVEEESFSGCSQLTKVVLKEGTKKIGLAAFEGCSFESISLPSTVTEIGIRAFGSCRHYYPELNSIPKKVASAYYGNAFDRCSSLDRFTFPNLSLRLEAITKAGQTEVENKIDQIPHLGRRGSEIHILAPTQSPNPWFSVKASLDKTARLIAYYEMKEATTLFELALWKEKIDQATSISTENRVAYRIEVPGPVKDTILQYI